LIQQTLIKESFMKIASNVAVSELPPPPAEAVASQQTTNANSAFDQPGTFTLFTTKPLDDSVTNIVDGYHRIVHPDSWGGFVHGTIQLTGALPQAVGADLGGNLQQGAQWVNGKVNGIPVLQNIVKPVGDAVNAFGAVIGALVDGPGQAANDIGGAIEDLSHGDGGKALCKLGDTVKDLGSGVASAVSTVASSVGHAVKDIFSGW
jgi:hypothetical protein